MENCNCKCICGQARVDLHNTFVLGCIAPAERKLRVCDRCLTMWAMTIACSSCRVHCDVYQDPTDSPGLLSHIEHLHDMNNEKQNAPCNEVSLQASLEPVAPRHDERLEILSGFDAPTNTAERVVTGGKRKVGCDKPSECSYADGYRQTTDPRKRPKPTDQANCVVTEHKRKIMYLENRLATAAMQTIQERKVHRKAMADLGACCQKIINNAEEGDRLLHMANEEAQKKEQTIHAMQLALDTNTDDLSTAAQTISGLRAQADSDKQTIEKLNNKATEYENYARRTKAFYKAKISGLERARSTRLDHERTRPHDKSEKVDCHPTRTPREGVEFHNSDSLPSL